MSSNSSGSNRINLAGAVPNTAIEVANSKPNVRQAYETTSASSGDITGQIEDASSNDQILDLGSGSYQMNGGVDIGGSVGGIVGDGRDACTITCSADSYLFNISSEDFVMQGVTFQAEGDVAFASAQTGNAGWFEDLVFRGQRDKYSANGERMTFIIEADSGATNFIHKVEFPDGGTNHPENNTVGHAIGPNADPSHEGLNVWKEVYCEGFMDNGFYVNNSPGRNVLWNCTAVNNGGGNFNIGNEDVVVGGYSEGTDLPDDRISVPLVVKGGDKINVVGLELYGSGDAVGGGGEVIQVRSEVEGVSFDRTVAHADSIGSNLARLDEGTVDITDSWWLQEGTGSTAIQIGKRGSPAEVTADSTLRVNATDASEISGPITISGTSYSGTTSASEAGLSSPQPLPTFHFDGVESGQGSEYGGSGGGSAGGYGDVSTGPQQIDGSDSPGSRWGLTQERSATVQGPQASFSTTVEPQWFNTGVVGETGGTGGTGGTGDSGGTGSAQPGVSDGQVDLQYNFTTEIAASEGPSAIQSALDSVSEGEGVRVTGSGSFEWGQTIEVPDGKGLDISTELTVTIPDSHSMTAYQDRGILSLITNANRNGAQDVTIRGGQFDFSNVTDQAPYAGIWVHNATNSQIRDTVVNGAGTPVYGSSDIRSFNVAMTACDGSGIYDSEANNAGYDNFGLRGSNTNCEVIGCSGSGASSGTIQAAAWGKWDIGGGWGENILIKNSSGPRIYCHGTTNATFDGCTTGDRIQTIGIRNSATIRNSQEVDGRVLLYTLDHPQPQTTIENMGFTASGSEIAIEMGTNGGQPIGTVNITDCSSQASTFMNFTSYDNPGGIDTVAVENSTISGSTIVSQESSGDAPETLRFTGCEFDNLSTGITGSYGTLVVQDCTFTGMTEEEAFGEASAQVQASGNTFN